MSRRRKYGGRALCRAAFSMLCNYLKENYRQYAEIY